MKNGMAKSIKIPLKHIGDTFEYTKPSQSILLHHQKNTTIL